jgi:hypothetical protein
MNDTCDYCAVRGCEGDCHIPFGFCHCGCGQKTPIAQRRRFGNIPGQPMKYVKNHTPTSREGRRRYKAEAKKKGKALLADYLSQHPCADCGETDPIVLAFHHRNPEEKRGAVVDLISRLQSNTGVLLAEIAKCDILCANCHLRRHAADGWKAMKNPAKFTPRRP